MWCTRGGEEEPPYILTPHCRIVQYRRLQLQCILHFHWSTVVHFIARLWSIRLNDVASY
jgi:hypothetical protein